MEFLNLIPEDSQYRHVAEEALSRITIIPPYCRKGVLAWFFEGHRSGEFLMAVFRNDLFEAVAHADPENIKRLRDYVQYLYNYTLKGCYGSEERVNEWAAHGGLAGLVKKEREE